jgi:hypothetical protein
MYPGYDGVNDEETSMEFQGAGQIDDMLLFLTSDNGASSGFDACAERRAPCWSEVRLPRAAGSRTPVDQPAYGASTPGHRRLSWTQGPGA